MKEFDAIIIGFGKGGKTLATELAQHGWKVAVIERSDKMYGGTCINTGCIPTKALIHQAELATQKKGLSFEERKADYRKAIAFKNNVTDKLRKKTTITSPGTLTLRFTRVKDNSSHPKSYG